MHKLTFYTLPDELSSSVLTNYVYPRIKRSGMVLLWLCLLSISSAAVAQSLQDFKELWVYESREYLLNNQKPLPYLQSGFHQFSRLRDERFLDSLQNEWSRFTVIPGIPVPKSRRFESAPQFVFEESSYHNPQYLPCHYDRSNKQPEEIPLPRIRKPEYVSSSPLKIAFKFFGNPISLSYDRLLALSCKQEASKEAITEFWQKFTIANSNHLVGQLMAVKDRLGLNDWGYFLLVKDCSSALYPTNEIGSISLAWALMIRSGYNVRIGYNQLGISILYATTSRIFNVPTVKIGGTDFYVDQPISSFPIYAYSQPHEGANNPINLTIHKSLNFQGISELKKIQFGWNKKMVEFNLKYNPEIIRFLDEYPAVAPEICYDASFSAVSIESINRQLKPVVASLKKEEAVAFLQQFVQKSFAYFPYNDLFGHDRFMFPEELLFKDAGNDKGKALLFAWLVSHIMNQKAALVEFPGFWSVAVSLDQPLDGDSFLVDGKSYTIAEPTFDNAPIGLVMKEFYHLKPFIKVLKNRQDILIDQDKIWKLANAFGAKRSGGGEDYLQDEIGNSYITGFLNELPLTKKLLAPTPFIAKFDKLHTLLWVVKLRTSDKAFGLGLKQLDNGELYLAGSFRGKLEANGISIQTANTNPDLFFAQFNSTGEVSWLTKAGIDQLEEDTKLFYIIQLTRAGEIKSVELSNEDERSGKAGFRIESGEGLCYVASRYQSIGLDIVGDEPFAKSFPLKLHLGRMQQLGIEPITAILASILQSVGQNGNQLSESELAKVTLNKSNMPVVFKNILLKLKGLKNTDGIIELTTTNAAEIKLTNLQIENHARFILLPLDNNDLKLNILNGFTYHSGNQHERINSLIFELTTGRMILEVGSENTTISKPVSSEVMQDHLPSDKK